MGKYTEKILIFAIVLLCTLSFSTNTHASYFSSPSNWGVTRDALDISSADDLSENPLQQKEDIEPKIEYLVVSESVRQITAYNVGDIYQTDDTPCIGAYAKVNLCDEVAKGVRVCAANFVPKETILRIFTDDNESFECVVWDRMNSRYKTRVDIAMSLSEKSQARQFGLQKLKVQVLEKIDNEVAAL